MKSHPPGLIAMACGENARYTICWMTALGMARPTGTRIYSSSSLSIAESWNHTITDMLLPNPELEWVLFLNDDHVYEPDTLMRLLDHELDVVTGLYCRKAVPFGPVLYDAVDEDGYLTELSLPDTPAAKLVPIVACGDGALLVRRHVFELIDTPWWEYGATDRHDKVDHDVTFCAKLRAAGIKLFADLSVTVGHITPISIRPIQQPDGSWHVGLFDRHGVGVEILTVPAAETTEGVV